MVSNKTRCTYNVSLWCVRIATAAMEKHYVLNIMSMHQHPCLSNPAYKLHILCIVILHVWPVWLYPIFPHYLINSTIFRKNVPNIKCVFWFSLQIYLKHFSFQKEGSEILSSIYKHLHIKCQSSCQILIKFEFSWQIFETSIKIKFHQNLSSGSQVFLCGQTDKVNRHFSQFCKHT